MEYSVDRYGKAQVIRCVCTIWCGMMLIAVLEYGSTSSRCGHMLCYQPELMTMILHVSVRKLVRNVPHARRFDARFYLDHHNSSSAETAELENVNRIIKRGALYWWYAFCLRRFVSFLGCPRPILPRSLSLLPLHCLRLFLFSARLRLQVYQARSFLQKHILQVLQHLLTLIWLALILPVRELIAVNNWIAGSFLARSHTNLTSGGNQIEFPGP
jgi:hypothetical protein